jgi:inosine-uridine nucleoside N-ribohydrolase
MCGELGEDMKKNHILVCVCVVLVLCVFWGSLDAHSYKVPLIVDTDMALDDARALVMLINQDMADIFLMVTSDGAVSSDIGARNLITLLRFLKKDIEIAAGRNLGKKAPIWRAWSENILPKDDLDPLMNRPKPMAAADLIVNRLRSMDNPVIYLCLGPMTNLADALKKDSSIKEKISRIVYYGDSPEAKQSGWNTERDLESAKIVFGAGIRIVSLYNPGISELKFDLPFYNKLAGMNTPAIKVFEKLHSNKKIQQLLSKGHFRIWDELAVIYLERPDLFQFTPVNSHYFVLKGFEKEKIFEMYQKLLWIAADSHIE